MRFHGCGSIAREELRYLVRHQWTGWDSNAIRQLNVQLSVILWGARGSSAPSNAMTGAVIDAMELLSPKNTLWDDMDGQSHVVMRFVPSSSDDVARLASLLDNTCISPMQ